MINVSTLSSSVGIGYGCSRTTRFGHDPAPQGPQPESTPPAAASPQAPTEATQQPSRWKQRLKKYGPWAILFFTVKGLITSTAIGGALWAALRSAGCSGKPENTPAITAPEDPSKSAPSQQK